MASLVLPASVMSVPGPHVPVDHAERLEDLFDRLRKKDDVGLRRGFVERQSLLNRAAFESRRDRARRADADDASLETGFAQRQRERAADESDAGDRDDAPRRSHASAAS